MTLTELIRGRRAIESGESANANSAKAANDGQGTGRPLAGLAALALATPADTESDALPDPAAEARRQRALAKLADNPALRLAVVCDAEAEAGEVPIAVAIRGKGTCEVRVPEARFDPFALLDLVQRHGGTVH